MTTRKSIFMYSKQFEEYRYPPECPFDVSRPLKVREIANSMGLLAGSGRSEVAPKPAEKNILEKFHTARYLEVLKVACEGHWDTEALRMGIGTGDCPIFRDMYDYSVLACGATLDAVNLILSGSADAAFNPSGGLHHAGPERASGFCYMNDVALACLVLAEAGKKVLYIDVDVHQGDGVLNAFYERSDVLTISFHESPWSLFPGTGFEDEIGTEQGRGYCVNVPLPIGTYDQAYMKAFKAIVPPLAGAFGPDVIVFELGADALVGDPLAHLCLTNNTYADIVEILLSFNKPILMTGGGGYNVENTVRAWALAWSVLCGGDINPDMSFGVGGVMLESTDWQGGLRDREFVKREHQADMVLPAIEKTIEAIKTNVFTIHGL